MIQMNYGFWLQTWLSGFGHAKICRRRIHSSFLFPMEIMTTIQMMILCLLRTDMTLTFFSMIKKFVPWQARAGVDLVGCSSTGGADVNEGGDEEESEEGTEEGNEENISYSFQDEMDIAAVGGNVLEGRSSGFTHKVESNDWRPVNTSHFGLDGWAEVHSSWVRIKKGSEFVNGGRVEGDYQVFYTALESNSRLLVKGSFVVESLREDTFSYNFFEDQKRDQYDTEFCGGAK